MGSITDDAYQGIDYGASALGDVPVQTVTQAPTTVANPTATSSAPSTASILPSFSATSQAVAPAVAGSDQYVTNNSLVEKRLEALLAKENPLLKQAQLYSRQAANKSGMANSTMADQAGVQAVISKGLEIVSPDAATYSTASLQRQQSENTGALNTQQANYTSQDRAQQGSITAGLQQQQKQLDLAGQQYASQITREEAQYGAVLDNAASQYAGQLELDKTRFSAIIEGLSLQQKSRIQQTIDIAQKKFDEGIEKMQIEAEQRLALAQIFATSEASYLSNVTSAMTDPDLDADAKAAYVEQMGENFYTDMETTGNIMGISLSFS